MLTIITPPPINHHYASINTHISTTISLPTSIPLLPPSFKTITPLFSQHPNKRFHPLTPSTPVLTSTPSPPPKIDHLHPHHTRPPTLTNSRGMVCLFLEYCLAALLTVSGMYSSTRFKYTSSFCRKLLLLLLYFFLLLLLLLVLLRLLLLL